MPDNNQNSDALRYAARQAVIRQRILEKAAGKHVTESGLILPSAAPSPEHYHILYHVPKDDVIIPDYSRVYIGSREAYQELANMARGAEPNVEWYENGTVGFETRLHGRADLWWIVCEVAACIRSQCEKTLQRQGLKRRLVLVKDTDGES